MTKTLQGSGGHPAEALWGKDPQERTPGLKMGWELLLGLGVPCTEQEGKEGDRSHIPAWSADSALTVPPPKTFLLPFLPLSLLLKLMEQREVAWLQLQHCVGLISSHTLISEGRKW